MANVTRMVEETAQLIVRRNLQTLPLDPLVLDSTPEEEVVRYAESIAILRPRAPYPNWRTDADLNNPDLTYQLRRWLWQYYHDRKREVSMVAPWHEGTRLRLFLGNDESAQIYVAGCMEPA